MLNRREGHARPARPAILRKAHASGFGGQAIDWEKVVQARGGEEEGFYILASQQGCVDVLGKVFPSQKHWL